MKKILISLFLICAAHLMLNGQTLAADKIDAVILENSSAAETLSETAVPDKKMLKEIEKQHKKSLKKYKKLHKAEKKAEKAEKKARNKALKKSSKKAEENTAPAASGADNNAYKTGVNEIRIMQLNECISEALKNHPSIQAAMADADIYKSRISQAWSAYFPVLSAGVSYSRNDAQASNITPPVQRYNMYYVPNVTASMLLFDFGKTKAEADMSKRGYEAAQYSLASAVNTVIFNVKQAYYNLLFAHQQVKVYEDTVNDFKLHLEQAKAYYDIGKKPKIDVLTAEYNLGKAELNLIQANNTLQTAFVKLSNAMGMPDFTGYDADNNVTAEGYDISIDEAVNTSYETSPELLAAQKRSDASYVLVRASKRAFLPDLSGFASYTRGGTKPDTDYGWQIGAQLGYNGINLLLTKKQMDEAKAQYKKDFADYQNIKQNIYYKVKEAYLNMAAAQKSISVAKLSMEQAKEQYDSAAGRYKSGLGDAVELKDAETTFRNAQLNYFNTILNYNVSAANLECLMGVPLNKSGVDLL